MFLDQSVVPLFHYCEWTIDLDPSQLYDLRVIRFPPYSERISLDIFYRSKTIEVSDSNLEKTIRLKAVNAVKIHALNLKEQYGSSFEIRMSQLDF